MVHVAIDSAIAHHKSRNAGAEHMNLMLDLLAATPADCPRKIPTSNHHRKKLPPSQTAIHKSTIAQDHHGKKAQSV